MAARRTCAWCSKPLPAPARTGRPRRYCNDACRIAHRRAVLPAPVVDWTSEAVEVETVVPAPPAAQRRRETVEALIGVVEGSAPSDPEARLARGILEARTLGWQFRRLAREVGRDLSWRAAGVADDLDKTLDRYFPDPEGATV